jgi:hypothetical protein
MQRADRAADGGVVDMLRALSGRHRCRELLRNTLFDFISIVPATALVPCDVDQHVFWI